MNSKNPYFLILIFTLFLPGCSVEKEPYRDTRILLGTYVTIRVQDADKARAEKERAVREAFGEIKRIEDLLSSFKEGNIIAKINSSGAEEVIVDEDTFYVLSKAKYFYEISGGAFDITVLPLLELWGFHGRNYFVPSQDEIKSAVENAGSDKVVLDKEKVSVRLLKEGMKIDLGGIAKGYAVDRAVFILKKNGVKNAVVDAGGDIYCLGVKSKNKKWSIGIRDPLHKNRIIERLELLDMAVATSGNYENFFEKREKRYSHIINPKTGEPAQNDLASVTIIADDCLSADALATAVMVLGKRKGIELIKTSPKTRAIIITKDGEVVLFPK